MEYTIKYQRQAVQDAARLQKSEPNAFKKLLKLEAELREHPRTGTGHPEQLKGNRNNQWSRRITESTASSTRSTTPRWWCWCLPPMGITKTGDPMARWDA